MVGRHTRKEYQLPKGTEPSNRSVGSTIKVYHHRRAEWFDRNQRGRGGTEIVEDHKEDSDGLIIMVDAPLSTGGKHTPSSTMHTHPLQTDARSNFC